MVRGRTGARFAMLAAVLALAPLGASAQDGSGQDVDAAAELPRDASVYLELSPELVALGCATDAELRAAVEARLARALASSLAGADLVLAIELTEAAPIAATLTLRYRDGEVLGVREIRTRDRTCATLAEGLPLVVAMLVDLHRREASLHLPAVAPPPRLPPPPPPPPAPPPPPPPRVPLEVTLATGLVLDVGWLPEPALRPEVALRLAPDPALSIDVSAGVVLPQEHFDSDVAGVEVWGITAAASLCPTLDLGPARLAACAGVEAGWLSPAGLAFERQSRSDAAHASVLAHGRASLEVLAPFFVELDAGVSVPLLAQRFVYLEGERERVLFTSSPVSFRAALHIGLRAR